MTIVNSVGSRTKSRSKSRKTRSERSTRPRVSSSSGSIRVRRSASSQISQRLLVSELRAVREPGAWQPGRQYARADVSAKRSLPRLGEHSAHAQAHRRHATRVTPPSESQHGEYAPPLTHPSRCQWFTISIYLYTLNPNSDLYDPLQQSYFKHQFSKVFQKL